MTDFRCALRALRQNPTFTLVTVATLALGIGAVTAVFTVVNGVLLEPLPFPDPDRLVEVESIDLDAPDELSAFAEPDFAAYREASTRLEALAAYRGAFFTLTGDGDAEQLWGARVTGDYFAIMGSPPALGRAILPEDDRPGAAKVVVLEHALWRQRFGADPAVLGRRLTLNGESYQVIGVTAPKFGGSSLQLFLPFGLDLAAGARGRDYLFARGRLAAGATAAGAQRELRTIAARLAATYPEFIPATSSVRVVSLFERVVSRVRPALWTLHGAVTLLLVIACVNVAGLLLTRSASRRREVAIRAALGAGRFRLLRQRLVESLVLTTAGGAAGILLGGWGAAALLALGGRELPRPEEIAVDGRVVLFVALVTVVTGLAFGLFPLGQGKLAGALREGLRGQTTSPGGRRSRFALILTEVALALVLLIGSGLLARSFLELTAVDPGFATENGLVAFVDLPLAQYGEEDEQIAFYRQLCDRAAALPGVEAAGAAFPVPLSGGRIHRLFGIAGRELALGENQGADSAVVSPGFFRALGIRLERGRVFTDADTRRTPRVVVLNASAARHFFPGEEALGQRLTFDTVEAEEKTWWTVVGVVADVRQSGLDMDVPPLLYLSYLQSPIRRATLVLKTATDPRTLAGPLRRALRELDADLPLARVRTLRELVAASVSRPRFHTVLLGVFAALALLIAVVGIYGHLGYSVARRRHEIGVRMALGADRGAVCSLFVRQGMAPVLVGLVLGVALAALFSRVLESLVFGVATTDAATYAAVTVLLAAVAAAACWLPARRAAAVDPLRVLRDD